MIKLKTATTANYADVILCYFFNLSEWLRHALAVLPCIRHVSTVFGGRPAAPGAGAWMAGTRRQVRTCIPLRSTFPPEHPELRLPGYGGSCGLEAHGV